MRETEGKLAGELEAVRRRMAELEANEEARRESEDMLRAITDAAKDAIIMMDHDGNISFWNPAAERMFGYAAPEAMGKELHSLLGNKRYLNAYKKGFPLFRETGKGLAIGRILELEGLKKDGTVFPVELSISAIQIKGKWHAVGILRDITRRKVEDEEFIAQLGGLVEERTEELRAANDLLTREVEERRRAEDALRKSEKFLKTIFHSIHDPFSIVDRNFVIVKVNDAYARLKNMSAAELVGKRCFEVLQGRRIPCKDCVVVKTFNSKDPCAKEKRLDTANGHEPWVEILTYPIFDDEGVVSHVIEYTRDITDRKRVEDEKKRLIERLGHLSRTDALTGILNRRAIVEELRKEVDRTLRYGTDLSLILCDVDYFKNVNDTYGHSAGDAVLRHISGAICSSLRRTDIAGRYGGDEFILVLPGASASGARDIAERIRHLIEQTTYRPEGDISVNTTLSFGVSSFVPDMRDMDTLIKWADTALYAAKEAGRNRVRVVGFNEG